MTPPTWATRPATSRSTCSTAPGGTAGQQVSYVQNVTDVDDPLLERATATGVDWRDLAASQIELFQTDMEALNVLAPDHYVGAVEVHSADRARDRAARCSGAWPTAWPAAPASPTGTSTTTSKPPASTPPRPPTPGPWAPSPACPTPRCWSSSPNAAATPAAPASARRWTRCSGGWPATGEPSWPGGELGEGRPGWHIECTVIAQKYLPAPFTVQGGGSDLIFPHHEMGAGHAYSLSGVPLAHHFAHAGMVGLDGEKMSKSKGNLVLVSKLRAAGEEPGRDPAGHPGPPLPQRLVLDRGRVRRGQGTAPHLAGALAAAPAGSAAGLVSRMRAELSNDLNAPGRRRRRGLTGPRTALARPRSGQPRIAALVSDAVDALLGVEL